MIKLTLSEIVEAVKGRTVETVPPLSANAVSTDSREVASGDVFFALSGDRFDGHEFVTQAAEGGALAAVVAQARVPEVAASLAALGIAGAGPVLIGVDDVLAALGRLAHYHRRLLSLSVIAVAGSNGKTTTKSMVDHILGERFTGRASPRSFNNAIGVPLTLLSAAASDDYLVVEIGTNAPGEVAALAELARPTLAVITSIAEEHLEGLGDLGGVAAEECSVLGWLESGFAAVNVEWAGIQAHLPAEGLTLTTFGTCEDADLRVSDVVYEPPWLMFRLNGRFEYRLPMPGAHNALNAAGAVAVGRRLGLDHDEIAARLATYAPPALRCELQRFGDLTVLNDAYNANPQSMRAALEMLVQHPSAGRRIAVLGEMRELGPRSAELHAQVAEHVRACALDHVVLVGAAGDRMQRVLSARGGPALTSFVSVDECVLGLPGLLRAGDVVLLKGSRAVGLERLVTPLRKWAAFAATG